MIAPSTLMRRLLTLLVAAGILSAAAPALAQRARGGAGGPGMPGVSPLEIQRMFDSYALMQAQDQLQINDAQFPRFLTRYKALQDLRRKTLQERARLVLDLRRLVNEAQPDEAQIRADLKALRDLDTQSQADVRKAYDAIDEVLDLHQQAKFRIFEELMERRKLELITRARQANRPKL